MHPQIEAHLKTFVQDHAQNHVRTIAGQFELCPEQHLPDYRAYVRQRLVERTFADNGASAAAFLADFTIELVDAYLQSTTAVKH